MKKITVITGPARIGKTRKAKEMAEKYNENEVVFLSIRKRQFLEEPFFLGSCNSETKLIILDDVLDVYAFEKLVAMLFCDGTKLLINEKSKRPFLIERPEIIITCDEAITRKDLESLPNSVTARIEIVDLTQLH